MIFEVRDYHYRHDIFDAYKDWAKEAVPILRRHLDVVGFWIDEGQIDPEIEGTDPINSPIGSANVTWVIRWKDKAARDAGMERLFSGEEWQALWARHPDPNGYLQSSARFMEEI